MIKKTEQLKNDHLQPRPPVVVVLGHVDHGKTTLLDWIRKTKVAEKESGGITQHIGAYEVVHQGKKITFIDTPGHEAFSAIRSRGARVADIAILVVAAEEGIKPQTKEAILHIKKAGIPLVVAINKVDKSEANPEKVKRELVKEDVLLESMGGKVPSVLTSAKTGQGVDALLELILIVAEMEEFKGNVEKPAEGVVIEAYLDNQRGPCATLLLRDGVLRAGDLAVTPSTLGKVKVLEDFRGNPVGEALPSMPCIVIGFEKVPQVGEKFEVYESLELAQKYIEEKTKKMKGGEVFFAEEGKKILNLILKADVLGSIEAIKEVMKSLPQEKVILRVLKSEIGEINESDVKLAKSSSARILGFRVKADSTVLNLAERDGVRIMTFDIIYEMAQFVRQMMEKALSPEKSRVDLGKVKVLAIFHSEKNRQIIGGKVIEGEIKKGSSAEVFREAGLLGRGKIVNLQKNKKEADLVRKGEECGLLYEGDVKAAEGDILQTYETRSQSQSID